MEEWKILQYDDKIYNKYEISSFGRLRIRTTGRICKLNKNSSGYIGYYKPLSLGENKRKYIKIHRAVAFAFLPNPKLLPEVNHKDGDKSNNNINNLEWISHKNNIKHARKTGLYTKPSGYSRKLTADDVRYVRDNRSGMSIYKLAKEFGVCRKTMKNIMNFKTYKDIV